MPDFWHRILTDLESEWDLMVAKSAALRVGLNKRGIRRFHLISRVQITARRLRKFFSRSRLASRLFGHEKTRGAIGRPGLILIQIDGLSRHQMQGR